MERANAVSGNARDDRDVDRLSSAGHLHHHFGLLLVSSSRATEHNSVTYNAIYYFIAYENGGS